MPQLSRKVVNTGDGLFKITLVCPKQVMAGGTARFRSYFLHQRDGPVNPTGLTLKIYEGNQLANLLSNVTIYQDVYGLGSYFGDYNVPSSQGTGPLTAVWNGSYESVGTSTALPVQAFQVFRVINEMGVVA
jgi:hypothetical protein